MGGERLDTRNPTSKLMLTILVGVATDCESHPPTQSYGGVVNPPSSCQPTYPRAGLVGFASPNGLA